MHAVKLSGEQTVEARLGGEQNGWEVRTDLDFAGTLSLAVTLE